MKQFYVYILKCSDDSYYTGITNNLDRRLQEHNSDKKLYSYTFSRRPTQIVWFEKFTTPDEAIAKEKQLKGWSRKKKEALINSDWDKLIQFSKK